MTTVELEALWPLLIGMGLVWQPGDPYPAAETLAGNQALLSMLYTAGAEYVPLHGGENTATDVENFILTAASDTLTLDAPQSRTFRHFEMGGEEAGGADSVAYTNDDHIRVDRGGNAVWNLTGTGKDTFAGVENWGLLQDSFSSIFSPYIVPDETRIAANDNNCATRPRHMILAA